MRGYAPISPANVVTALSSVQCVPTGDSNTCGLSPDGGVTIYSGYRAKLYQELATTRSLTTYFEGTITTMSTATPAGYQAGHEGVSGETIAQIETRMVGTWGGGGGVSLGSADDPGQGLRGHLETIVQYPRGNTWIVLHAGTNDATAGAVSTSGYQRLCQRLWAVGNAIPGGLRGIVCCALIGRTDSAPAQTRTDTFNAALPSVVTTLQAAGVFAIFCDTATGWNTGTMMDNSLGTPGLHMNNTTGAAFFGLQVAAALRSAGVTTA